MSSVQVRRFARSDRDQVTALVNAHIGAVVPNLSVSVQELMSQLESEPDEFIVDPWVIDRLSLVAEQRSRVVAAAHLLRYGGGEQVSPSYRDTGEIRWLVCWPDAPDWRDSADAGNALVQACVDHLKRWGSSRCYADGSLPAPGVYGVPEQWPHIHDIYQRAGFRYDGHTELVFVARVADLPRSERPPLAGLASRRSLGVNGTRISAILDAATIGYIEVDTALGRGARSARFDGWADVGNLHVNEAYRRAGVGSWLVGQAADWLELGEVTRLLNYADAEDAATTAFLDHVGFRLLTRTRRGLTLH